MLPMLTALLAGCASPSLTAAALAAPAASPAAPAASPAAPAASLAASPGALEDWIKPFRVATLRRTEQYDALPPDVGRYRIVQGPARPEPTRTLWEQCERRLDRRKPADCVLVFLGADGYGNAASPVRGASAWDWWSPPQVILPPRPADGARWEAVHAKRGGMSRRGCELRADTSFCDDGLESRCFTEFPQSAVVISEHYCRGVGWVGESALARYADGHRYRAFTSDLVVDGVAMPARRESPVTGPSTSVDAGGGAPVVAR